MKVLFIYNKHDATEVDLARVVAEELGGYVNIYEISEAGKAIAASIRDTPAIIPIMDSFQGDFITATDVDAVTMVHSLFNKYLDEEDQVLQNPNFNRLDTYINQEVVKRHKDKDVVKDKNLSDLGKDLVKHKLEKAKGGN